MVVEREDLPPTNWIFTDHISSPSLSIVWCDCDDWNDTWYYKESYLQDHLPAMNLYYVEMMKIAMLNDITGGYLELGHRTRLFVISNRSTNGACINLLMQQSPPTVHKSSFVQIKLWEYQSESKRFRSEEIVMLTLHFDGGGSIDAIRKAKVGQLWLGERICWA